jgi:nicotinamidase-related amidase
MKKRKAVLVIDMQQAILHEGPWQEERLVSCIEKVVLAAREMDFPIIYIRHNEPVGEPLEPHTQGWEIDARIAPRAHDTIIDKHYNSAFKKTPLRAHLMNLGVEHLIVMGLQTEYCIDATIKSAFDLDYDVIIPIEGHSTVDQPMISAQNLHQLYSERLWNGRYARVVSTEEVLHYILD